MAHYYLVRREDLHTVKEIVSARGPTISQFIISKYFDLTLSDPLHKVYKGSVMLHHQQVLKALERGYCMGEGWLRKVMIELVETFFTDLNGVVFGSAVEKINDCLFFCYFLGSGGWSLYRSNL